MTGHKVATPQEVAQPGDWCIEHGEAEDAVFYYIAPDGILNNGGFSNCDHIYIHLGEKVTGYWKWDGNVDVPTLSPSIWHKGASNWHGHFEGGKWRTL